MCVTHKQQNYFDSLKHLDS